MTKTYYPFNSGAGAISYQDRWSKVLRECRANGILPTVGDMLQPYADSTGIQIKLRNGAAMIMGHRYENDEIESVVLESSDASNPRIDRVVLHLDWVGAGDRDPYIDTLVLTGTPAPSPSAPELTQEDLSIWEIPIASVLVNAGALTLEADKVIDERLISEEPVSTLMMMALS